MYNNYGNVNFFEYGRMAEIQNDGTVNVLVCNPVFICISYFKNPNRCYQFDHINVDITDSWIDVNAVSSYADISQDDIIQFALACIDYDGTENFGGTCYYDESQFYTKNEVLDRLKYYDIEEV